MHGNEISAADANVDADADGIRTKNNMLPHSLGLEDLEYILA